MRIRVRIRNTAIYLKKINKFAYHLGPNKL